MCKENWKNNSGSVAKNEWSHFIIDEDMSTTMLTTSTSHPAKTHWQVGKKWKSRKRNLFFNLHKEKLSVMLQGILNLIQSSYNLEASIKLKKLLGIESPNVDIQGGKKGNNTLAAFLPLFFSFLYLFPHDFFFIFIFELGKLVLRWMKKCYHGLFLVVLMKWSEVKLLSRVWLFATPWTPGSSVHGIF